MIFELPVKFRPLLNKLEKTWTEVDSSWFKLNSESEPKKNLKKFEKKRINLNFYEQVWTTLNQFEWIDSSAERSNGLDSSTQFMNKERGNFGSSGIVYLIWETCI